MNPCPVLTSQNPRILRNFALNQVTLQPYNANNALLVYCGAASVALNSKSLEALHRSLYLRSVRVERQSN